MQQVLENFKVEACLMILLVIHFVCLILILSKALKGFQKAGVVYWLKVFDFSQGIRCWRCDRLETRVRFGVE